MQLLSGADKFLATQYESDCRIRIVLTYCDWEWNLKKIFAFVTIKSATLRATLRSWQYGDSCVVGVEPKARSS